MLLLGHGMSLHYSCCTYEPPQKNVLERKLSMKVQLTVFLNVNPGYIVY